MAPLGKKDGGRIGEDREKDSYKGTTAPVIELPKGGGALKGIDEKFSVNPSNGTSSFSFPLPFSPSRGPVPELVLNYNSGSGNGILGLGWSLSLSSIRRKTEQELPRYQDATDSDTYIFSGAEDLVPVIEKVGEKWKKKEQPDAGGKYTIRFYRPRIEGLFARIERWTKDSDGSIHWRVITKDNLTTIFGKDPAARIADPSDPLRIFEWFPQLVYDDKGHCVSYVYKKEDGEGIDKTAPHERNRLNGLAKYANTYLERIWYGNVQQYTPAMGDTLPAKFLFEAVFDYGEHDPDNPPFAETGKWLRRPDAFSGYRPGFEVRTYRRCERVLFYHHIDELPGGSALVRSVRFTYHDNSIDGFTFLGAITLTGYTKHAGGTYTHRSLPPFTFDYQRHEWNTEVRTIDPGSLVHAPAGISEPHYQWIDLFGEGVSGLLTEQAEGLFYKRNLGEGNFAPAQLVSPKPSFSRLQVSDLDSNNVRQLVQLEKEPKGFFAMEDDGSWLPFRPFAQLPNIDLQAANVKRLDLDGDGLTDVLVSEDDVFVWYPSKGTDGYGIPGRVAKTRDEEKGPAMVFSDPVQAILLADMSGDGLADLVRVRNGEICYWPNLGYGRFGAKVNMDNAPLFDTPDRFDPKLLRTADIDGSGTTDIVYLGRGAFSVWMNRQGNSFATAPVDIAPFPELSSSAQVSTLDLLGDGVSCIVWNCALPTHTGAPLRYIDLLNGKKPHLMTAYRDNAGKEVFLEYRSSTHYYFDDQQAGHQWITKLPFPVHCVSKTIAYDRIRKTRFASEYTYHHGFYDTHEREFRGFGRVEQTDAEQVEHFVKNSGGMMNNVVEDSLHQPPVLTKSWFHTGASLTGEKIHNGFAAEYYRNNQFTEYDMPGPQTGLAAATEDWREAQRACKGSLLRKEIYALDGSSEQDIPFVAEQHNLMVKVLQEKAINKHGVFFTHESESIAYHYEREPADPRVMHRFNLEVDAYGNLLRSAVVQYGRQGKDPDLVKEEQDVQSRLLLTCTRNDVTEAVTAPADDYRAPVTWQTRSYEITGNGPPSAAPYFTYADMDTATDPAEGTDLLYHETPSTGLERRLIEWVRTRFREDNGVAPLAFGKLRSKALVHETYKAAFSGALLDELFKTKTTDLLLGPVLIAATVEGGGYVKEDGHYWIPSGQQDYVAADFFLPSRFTDPFGKITKVEYGPYRLFAEKITDPMLNTVSVKQFSYRTLQPLRMEDANGNITAIRFDELGMVTAAFAAGKGADKGDVFDETNDEPSALDRPGAEFTYFIDEWYNQVQGGLDTNVYFQTHPNYE